MTTMASLLQGLGAPLNFDQNGNLITDTSADKSELSMSAEFKKEALGKLASAHERLGSLVEKVKGATEADSDTDKGAAVPAAIAKEVGEILRILEALGGGDADKASDHDEEEEKRRLEAAKAKGGKDKQEDDEDEDEMSKKGHEILRKLSDGSIQIGAEVYSGQLAVLALEMVGKAIATGRIEKSGKHIGGPYLATLKDALAKLSGVIGDLDPTDALMKSVLVATQKTAADVGHLRRENAEQKKQIAALASGGTIIPSGDAGQPGDGKQPVQKKNGRKDTAKWQYGNDMFPNS